MKVPGSDGSSEIPRRVKEGAVGDKAVKRTAGTDAGGVSPEGLVGELTKVQRDTFTVSNLGAQMREELDPVKMAAERRAHIEALKERIRNGTYAPPSEDVARAFGEEVSLEVIFGAEALKG
jgi:anti-sigma28 factor (negative regulator of flagellin synthesis)